LKYIYFSSAGASVTTPASDAAVVVDMRELVANMTLLRELVQAQANTIVFLEARVRVLEETSAPALVPSLTPTSVPTSAPTMIPTMIPTAAPTSAPSFNPTESPTAVPAAPIVPAGVVVWLASSSPPEGYLACDGRSVSRTSYPALFAVAGTTFGVMNATTFTLPDLRGEFIRGIDGGRGVDIGRGFGTLQSDAFQTHIHSTSFTSSLAEGMINHYAYGNDARYPAAGCDPNFQTAVLATAWISNWHTVDRESQQRNETP
jgi:microcystin-dependent protein